MSATEIQLDDKNERHRALIRLILARRDWDATTASLRYLIEHSIVRENPLFYALTAAAVVCYARPFLGGRSHARIPGKYEKFPDAMMRSSHQILLLHRNSVVAHANDEKHKITLMPKGMVLEWAGGKGRGTLVGHGEMIQCPELAPRSLVPANELVEFQLSRLEEHIEAEKNELFP
jgi:hypothetical protein